MIKIIIIEDERLSRKKLKGFLKRLDDPIQIIYEIESVSASVEVLSSPHGADLIFSDIELLDGNVFEAFNQANVDCPIIFITAYDTYWMDAFEANGIEYLLKPYTFDRLKKSWGKYLRLKGPSIPNQDELFRKLDAYYKSIIQPENTYKTYLPVTVKQETYFLHLDQIIYFQVNYGLIKAFDASGKTHILNQTRLTELEAILNPAIFFKINRSEIVNRSFVAKISRYGKNTLAITLSSNEILKTSQGTTASFNKWMGL